jgi:lambda family phage tail tape measure protein
VAYRADIEIAVRGAQELKRLQNEIRVASDAVDSLNSNLSGIANLVPRSFDNLNKTVAQAAKSFNAAALGTKEATDAAREYIQATDTLNVGLRERVALLAKVRAEQRRTVPGDAGTGQQTPALPPQLIRTYEIGKNWVKFFQDAAEVAVDLRARSLNTQKNWNDFFATAAQAAVNVKANSLNTQKNWNDFFATAAQAAVNVKANSLNTQKNWNDFFATAAQAAVNVKANSLNTQKNWNDFFATAAQAAVNVKANSLNTQKNWNDFFATAAQAAVNVKANSVNTKNSWNTFFTEAAQLANDLTDRTREIEGKNSAAARDRLAADAERRRNATPEVIRRPIAGLAAPEGMGPVTQFAQLGTVHSAVKAKYDAEMQFLTTITNIEREFDKQTNYLEIQAIQRELDAELDKIEIVAKAQKAADTAALKDFDARLKTRTATKGAAAKASSDRNAMMQNALIGGAFPMLFGGGAGAVLGGAAGGFIPGNPMMSIVTSALGTMVDQFVAGVTEMGVAVKDLVGNFDKLKEANLFVSKQQEFYIQKLIESGRVQEAANAIQQRLIDIIGTQGVQDLDNAGQASTRLNKALAELGIQMQALIAGPLGVIIDRIAAAVALPAASNTATAVQQQLVKQGDKAAAGELGSRVQEIEQRPSLQLGLGAKEAAQDITKLTTAYSQLLKKTETNASISLVDREKTIKQAEQIFTELRDKERAQQELKRQNAEQYADLVRSLQRQQADLNLQYERRAQDLRISNAEKQLDLVKAIGAAQLQQLQNESRARQIEAGGGTGLAAEIATALDTYDIELKRIGQEAADAEQRAKLNIIKLDIENERFKLDNAKAIARTNLDNQLRIQRINEQINRQNAELSRRNYEQDIQTASITLVNIRADAQANKTIAQAALAQRTVTEDQRAYYTAMLKGFEQVIQETEKATEQVARGFIKPSALPTMAAAPTLQQPGTAAADAQIEKYKELIAQLTAIETGQNRVNAETAAYLTLVEKTTQFVTQFEAQTVTIENEIEARKLRNRLALEGVAPERIEGELRILELTRAYNQTIGVLDAKLQQLLPVKIENTNEAYQAALGYLAELEALGPLTKAQEELRKKLQDIVDLRERLGTAVATSADNARTTAAAQVQTPQEKIEERIGALKKELADLTNVGNIAITVADGIGEAFSTAFQGLISGSISAREALSGFFKSVGDMFVEMAAQIIAKQMTMIILQTILKALGAAGGGGVPGANSASALGSNPNVAAYAPLANGGTFANGIATFANGGAFTNSIVSSPTMFKFADGGTTRTGLMGEAGPEAIMPLKRGSDGSLGVQATGLREAMGRPPGGANGSTVLNMSFQSTTINGTEYVSRDQLEAAMAATRRQAAKEGANRGMNMTLDKIQNSPSTRSRVGIR